MSEEHTEETVETPDTPEAPEPPKVESPKAEPPAPNADHTERLRKLEEGQSSILETLAKITESLAAKVNPDVPPVKNVWDKLL